MSEIFEIVNATPPKRFVNAKYSQLHLELMKVLLTVPYGKSIRKGWTSSEEARGYQASVKMFLKKQELTESYFVSSHKIAEADGKFYVYIGRKSEN